MFKMAMAEQDSASLLGLSEVSAESLGAIEADMQDETRAARRFADFAAENPVVAKWLLGLAEKENELPVTNEQSALRFTLIAFDLVRRTRELDTFKRELGAATLIDQADSPTE